MERWRESQKLFAAYLAWEAPLIPTPILTVLSTFRKNGVQTLLMGGQACVFYGAAQVSKDVDLALLAEPANIRPPPAPVFLTTYRPLVCAELPRRARRRRRQGRLRI